jgi:predicted MFS family arabinose efflux permease
MTTYFLGGALGSAIDAVVYGASGWTGVCLLGAVFPVLACLLWVVEQVTSRRRRVGAAPAEVVSGSPRRGP